jgi:alpha-beta hydrolase superfamily lysophospholipase
MLTLIDKLVDDNTSVFAFNNRGVETIADLEYIADYQKGHKGWITAGTAHEVFEDCVDDVRGAVDVATKAGAREIYLLGHSTGCQKSIYFAHQELPNITGIILLAPISDYAAEMKRQGIEIMNRATKIARSLVRKGLSKQLLPPGIWYEILDAQRFLSLYDPNSLEEIFCYSQPHKSPKMLQSISLPILVLIPQRDEYLDRSAKQMSSWFERSIASPNRIVIIPNAPHDFQGSETIAAKAVKAFLSS